MNKIRIALFGISDVILYAVKNAIDPRKAEIVLFMDNNKMKQGISYMNIPVVAPLGKLINDYSVDVCLVTALSAYEDIRSQLIDVGINKNSVQVFVAEEICKYCLGPIDDIDIELIKRIYFEPDKAIDIVGKYKNIYRHYLDVSPYDRKSEEWFNKSSLISHACGGIVNGRKIMYSNSREAFQYSIDKKFRLIECDMLRMDSDELVLGHDYRCFYEAEESQYSIMTAEELLKLIKEYKEVSCLIDIKWKDCDEYTFFVKEIDKLIENISDDNNEKYTLKSQIVMEVYDEATIRIAKENNFNMIFTQYRNPDWKCFMNTVNLCYKYGVGAIALGVSSCFEMEKFIGIFLNKNIKIFAFSTDSIEEYSALRKMGVTGVFTNYLTENNIV